MITDRDKLPKTPEELEAIIKPYESRIEFLEERIRVLEKIIFSNEIGINEWAGRKNGAHNKNGQNHR